MTTQKRIEHEPTIDQRPKSRQSAPDPFELWPQDTTMIALKDPSASCNGSNSPDWPAPAARSSRPAAALIALAAFASASLWQPFGAGPAHALTAGLNAAAGHARIAGRETAGFQRISAEDFKVGDISGPVSQPLGIDLKLPANPTVTYSFLMFRNMPQKFTLSAGFGAKDYWAVSLHDVDGLQMIPTDEYEGAFTLEVLLVKGMGSDPERRTAQVTFSAKGAAPAVASNDDSKLLTAARPDEATSAIPPLGGRSRAPAQKTEQVQAQQLSAIDESMMQRGDAYVAQGDIAAARLLYRQLAKKGIAAGALAMGNTYDPEFLATLPIRGLRPDLEQAKNWFRMAEELGSAQAARRLSALGR
jgi:hypothetical protein